MRELTENELLETLHKRQHEWTSANGKARDIARLQFMNAMQVFNALVPCDERPKRSGF